MKEKIDFVILWVDGSDPEWLKEKAKYNLNKVKKDGVDGAIRYRDWDNLKYWFRGVEKYAPWVNNVYFITWGHLPKWLNTNHPKLKIIKHEDYIPKKYLPIFSSNPIELNINRIEELSEQFVLFNDDMFLINDVKPEDFFIDGLPVDNYNEVNLDMSKEDPVFASILRNNYRILSERYNKRKVILSHPCKYLNYKYGFGRNIRTLKNTITKKEFIGVDNNHIYQPFLKSYFAKAWDIIHTEMDHTSSNRFRDKSDISQFLIRYFQLLDGHFIPKGYECGKYFSISKDNQGIIDYIEGQKGKCICINDTDPNIDFEKCKSEINNAFDKILNKKSKFRKVGEVMRTKKTARNLIISTILTTLVALIGLFKIKVFLAELGDEATGIYQLFTQIFSYISLVDAGLTSSLLYSLYKPVSDENHKKINEILKGGHNFYSKIAIIIIAIGIILSFKIDFFLSDYTLPLNYIRICFILFIVSSGINYFVTPQKVILEARQNLYKVHMVVYTSIIIKGLLEIALLLMHLKLLSLMLLAIGISIIQNIVILIIAKKDYHELDIKDAKPDNSFTKETKNLMVQKVTGIIFNNIDVILISKYISSASVVIYTSYNYIITSIQNIVKKIGSSSLASVGNLLVTDKSKAKNIFYEYNAMCFYIANILCVPLLLVITSFVSIFYGEAYVLPYLGSVCIVTILYFRVIDIPLEVFAEALGYFDKLKKCLIIQSVINLSLSLILLFKIGISGVILATVISFIVGEFALYPQILNKNYFKDDKINYYGHSAKLLIIGIVSYLGLYLFVRNITVPNLLYWFLLGLGTLTINFIIVTVYFILTKETSFFERFKRLIKERRNNNA